MKMVKNVAFLMVLLLALSMAYAAKPGDKYDEDKYVGITVKLFGNVYISSEQAAKTNNARDIMNKQLEMLANTLDWDTPITPKMKSWALVAREEGYVHSQKEKEEAWSLIWQSRLLKDGDKIKTDANSQATIILPDESRITIEPNTEVLLTKDMFTQKTTLRIYTGKIYDKLSLDIKRFFGKEQFGRSGKEGDWEITTPNGILGSRGTEFEVDVTKERTLIRVYEGAVEVKDFYDNSAFYVEERQQAVLWKDKPHSLISILDEEPLEITMGESPCYDSEIRFAMPSESQRTTINITLNPFEEQNRDWTQKGIDWEYMNTLIDKFVNTTKDIPIDGSVFSNTKKVCLPPALKPKLVFVANKVLDFSTINSHTVEVRDENNKLVEGLYEVDSAITFIPSRPLYGRIRILVKGGEKGVCSRTKVCLEQDAAFELEGASRVPKEEENVAYELQNTIPAILTKSIVITNTGATAAKDVTISTYSYKTYFPNTFVRLYNISSTVPYEILEQGENEVHKFIIKELPPGKTLVINETYAVLSFGEEYFQRLDVSGLTNYDNATLVEMFIKPEEGIESDAPEIRELAQSIVGEEENPFWKAYKLYNWITANVQYDYDKEARITKAVDDERAGITAYSLEEPNAGAMATFHSRKGVCYDYARLYIALARAAGIPSRMVLLDVVSGDEEFSGHSTVEIYLPKYKWIPLDPTWGRAFDNFAREEPFIFPDYKQDGVSPLYEYLPEGDDAGQLKVLIFKDISLLKIEDEQEWARYFPEPFFKDLYELQLISNVKKNMEWFDGYNQLTNESLFMIPLPSTKNSLAATSHAIQAYQNQEYPSVQETVQITIKDNLRSSLGSFISVNEKVIDFVSKEKEQVKNEQKHLEEIEISGDEVEINFSLKRRYQEQNGTVVPINYDNDLSELTSALTVARELNVAINQKDYIPIAEEFIKLFYNSRPTLDHWANDLAYERFRAKEDGETIDLPGKAVSVEGKTVSLNLKEQLITWIIIVLLFIAAPVFWIWMWINCLVRKEFRHMNKILWFITVFFGYIFFPIGAIVYFFVEYRKGGKKEK